MESLDKCWQLNSLQASELGYISFSHLLTDGQKRKGVETQRAGDAESAKGQMGKRAEGRRERRGREGRGGQGAEGDRGAKQEKDKHDANAGIA